MENIVKDCMTKELTSQISDLELKNENIKESEFFKLLKEEINNTVKTLFQTNETEMKKIISEQINGSLFEAHKTIFEFINKNSNEITGSGIKSTKKAAESQPISIEEIIDKMKSAKNIIDTIYQPKKQKCDQKTIYYNFKTGKYCQIKSSTINLYMMNFVEYGESFKMLFSIDTPIKINDPLFSKFCGKDIKITAVSNGPECIESEVIINNTNNSNIYDEDINDSDIRD